MVDTVSVGRIVTYKLNALDAEAINDRPRVNQAHEGDEFPALVVRVWDPESGTSNLQVFYDGEGTMWATSRHEGVELGTWHWPIRV